MKISSVCLLSVLLMVVACKTIGTAPKMSFEEARDVVLSACDTGAGDGSGSEAVSGLGRAFFYSGARALLVTMWPVETTSANKLTTGLFQIHREQTDLSWARAQQQSILRLMEDPGLKNTKGDVVASYAHPIFWGPFVVIGASGVR